jgi:hypothetical protein
MPVALERLRAGEGDVYIDDPFEDVMFRYERSSQRFFRKFHGERAEDEVGHDNHLLNDAIRSGTEIDAETYRRGRPSS